MVVKSTHNGMNLNSFKNEIAQLAKLYRTEYPNDEADVYDRISCVLYDSY